MERVCRPPPGSLKGVVKPAYVQGRMEALYFVSMAEMGLQNHPHARLAPVIPVNKMGNQGAGRGPMAPGAGGLLPLREDGGQVLACQPVGLH